MTASAVWTKWKNCPRTGEDHHANEEGGGAGATRERDPEKELGDGDPSAARRSTARARETQGLSCIQPHQNTHPAFVRVFVSFVNHNARLVFAQAEYDRTKEPNQLTSKLESQAKGMEKIVMENERLRRDIRKVSDSFGCGGGLGKRVHMVTLL